MKTCPKCRCEIQDPNNLVKLFFGTSTNTSELNNEIDVLLDESEICRKKMEFMLQEMGKNVSFLSFCLLWFSSDFHVSLSWRSSTKMREKSRRRGRSWSATRPTTKTDLSSWRTWRCCCPEPMSFAAFKIITTASTTKPSHSLPSNVVDHKHFYLFLPSEDLIT